jgi:SAM-dependent methyltransferase
MAQDEMTDKTEVKSQYELEAEYYDELYNGSSDSHPANKIRIDHTVDIINSIEPDTILDIGCGTGQAMIPLLEGGYDIVGFDFSENMVHQAKENLEDAGFDPTRVRHGDLMNNIPFDGDFDFAIALGVLPHFEDLAPPLKEIKNLVKDGDIIVQLRNDLFDIYTLNNYTYEFVWKELLDDISLSDEARTTFDERLRDAYNMDQSSGTDDGSKFKHASYQHFHNPLVIEETFLKSRFQVNDILFFHYHGMLPEFEDQFPDEFLDASLELEDPTDWRGYLMASAFLVYATSE